MPDLTLSKLWTPCRLPRRVRVAATRSTTWHLKATWPLHAEATWPAQGVPIGEDFYQEAFSFDPFLYYLAGLLRDPNVFLLGDIGYGKSSLVKTYLWRQLPYGYWARVIDSKPEKLPNGSVGSHYALLVDAWNAAQQDWAARYGEDALEEIGLGAGRLIRLYPGGFLRLNPLDDKEGRVEILEDLAAATMQRAPSSVQKSVLAIALANAEERAASRGENPTLGDVHRALLHPAPGAGDREPWFLDDEQVRHEGQEPGHALLTLCRGTLEGMLDGKTSASLRSTTRPQIDVLDLSELRSTAALGIVMMLADRWFRHDPKAGRGTHVLEEAWRVLDALNVARDHQTRYKFARGIGTSHWAVMHHLGTIKGLGDEGSVVRGLVEELITDSATKIVYHQPSDQAKVTREWLGLTYREQVRITELHPGEALWLPGGRRKLVRAKVGADEEYFTNTDLAMKEAG